MALNGYFGRPGSGKSYSVVEYVIIPALKKGRHVVTNIPLESDLLVQVFGGQVTQLPLDALDDEKLPELVPHGSVAVIDECWRRWPSGQKVSQAPVGDLQWLKEHRHRVDKSGNAMQVVLVTQDRADLAAWVRKLIAHSFEMNKLEEVGMSNRFGIKVYKGCPTGEHVPSKYVIREAYGTYKPDIYQYYRSATQSEASDLNVGDEKAMDKRSNLFGSGQALFLMSFIVFAIVGGLYLGYGYVEPKMNGAKHAAQADEMPVVTAVTNPPPEAFGQQLVPGQGLVQTPQAPHQPARPAEPPLSGLWRVVGEIRRSDQRRNQGWDSEVGYGLSEAPGDSSKWLPDLVILGSLFGQRLVTMDNCKRFPDGIQLYCDIDGERVTSWSGQQSASKIAPTGRDVVAPVTGGGERSDPRPVTGATDVVRPASRITVVQDSSRTERTLIDKEQQL
ncbi:zonular occludens toxin domain-containing protein [Pseudomonas tohonis]|uniref:zonular occludens toxin domain-containing protein n=1 Tax=Pseudomonas tohonis TaxID=2725477 RepID=UPI0023EEC8A7|nr:zonular occludens toxin domain-containing protein [Pseudomonas tohonis]